MLIQYYAETFEVTYLGAGKHIHADQTFEYYAN
jgi:hypothetical protein